VVRSTKKACWKL